MERNIGEIFEYNGEWYQCVESQDGSCKHCDMNFEGKCPIPIKECTESGRSDKSYVIFKKLEKVGEPYTHYCPSGIIIYFQRYKIFNKSYSHNTEYIMCDFNKDGIVSIEIKQNKEDMEENKLNLKPFDLQKAKAGKPVCTRDGRKARIICFDRDWDMHIVALVADPLGESVHYYLSNGKVDFDKQNDEDLMMLPEKKEGWINIYNADTTFYYADGRVFETKDEAVQEAKEEVEKEQREKNEYIDTIRVEWEE